MRVLALSLVFLLAAHRPTPAPDAGPAGALTLAEADNRLGVAERMLQGGVHDRALALAESILDSPDARPDDAGAAQAWLVRREAARFFRDRARLGLADTRAAIEDVAEDLVGLSNNRYRLPEPAFDIQAAYWAGRAYEQAGSYRAAVEQYARVGGVTLPQDMEGDAAQRMSRCLRLEAAEIPYPGGIRDRQRRARLLNQAIAELDRARIAFPIGNRRKEVELDLIALRLARREEQYIREAATEAEAYIESDPAKDELRARASLYRGQAAAMLGNPGEAAEWFRKTVTEEAPAPDDRRGAHFGLAMALLELAETSGVTERETLLRQADRALDRVLDGAMTPGPWDGARVVKAGVQLEAGMPSAALATLAPILADDAMNYPAWRTAGLAERNRGRLGDALAYLYPVSRPSNPIRALRYAASRDAARTADSRRDYGIALALTHQASRMLREDRLYSSLLVQEFAAMETLLKLGKMDGPVSLSGDADLLMANPEAIVLSHDHRGREAIQELAAALGGILAGGGDPDAGYDLALHAEAADEWNGDGMARLELAIAMISHLGQRRPAGVAENVLHSRLGEARHAFALARAERILGEDEPDEDEIDRTLGDFAAAAASFQTAAAGGNSVQDSLDQGMVNMESGAFLMNLSARWGAGRWSGRATIWREEARRRIEASLKPFNQAIAVSSPSTLAARRARWSRGRAFELMGEWRGAAADYLSLMNNSELSRVLRVNAARRWAECMGKLGESRAALTRLGVFADIDAEAALLAGRLAEEAGNPREAYRHYLFAAGRNAPVLPPATPYRTQEAVNRAARIALSDPGEADPLRSPDLVKAEAREMLRASALELPEGDWAVPMLELLAASLLEEPDGWEAALGLSDDILARPNVTDAIKRAMHLASARALSLGGRRAEALDRLDLARELLDGSDASRGDAADITLETARIYRAQNREDDALRAYADVFAIYPDQREADDAARIEAATMLLSAPGSGSREREQARSILSGLQDQMRAEKIMREYGVR